MAVQRSHRRRQAMAQKLSPFRQRAIRGRQQTRLLIKKEMKREKIDKIGHWLEDKEQKWKIEEPWLFETRNPMTDPPDISLRRLIADDQEDIDRLLEDEELHFEERCMQYAERDLRTEHSILHVYVNWGKYMYMQDDTTEGESFFQGLMDVLYEDVEEVDCELSMAVQKRVERKQRRVAQELGIPMKPKVWTRADKAIYLESGKSMEGWPSLTSYRALDRFYREVDFQEHPKAAAIWREKMKWVYEHREEYGPWVDSSSNSENSWLASDSEICATPAPEGGNNERYNRLADKKSASFFEAESLPYPNTELADEVTKPETSVHIGQQHMDDDPVEQEALPIELQPKNDELLNSKVHPLNLTQDKGAYHFRLLALVLLAQLVMEIARVKLHI